MKGNNCLATTFMGVMLLLEACFTNNFTNNILLINKTNIDEFLQSLGTLVIN